MSKPTPPSRPTLSILAACLCLVLALPACKKTVTPPPAVTGLQLTPIEKNRPQLVATVTIRNVDASLARAAAISKTLDMPTGADDLRTMLVARSGLPPALIENLDLTRPIGVAFVGRQKGSSPFTAAAASAKSADAASRFITALGTKVEQKNDATHVKRPDGEEMWVVARDRILIASDSLDALVAAGEHAVAAIDAPGPANEDVTATLFPEAMARAEGTDLKTAVEKMRNEMAASLANPPTPNPLVTSDPRLMSAYMTSMFDIFVPWVLDTETVDIFLRVDEKDGVRLGTRIHPRAGTAFAARIADTAAVVPDPALLAGDAPAALFAMHVSEGTMQSFLALYDALAKLDIKGVKEVAAAAKTYLPLMQTSQFGRMNLGAKGLEYSVVMPLKAGSNPTAVMNAIDGMLQPNAMPTFLNAFYKNGLYKLTWARKDLTGKATVGFIVDKKNKQMAQMSRMLTGMFGTDRFEIALAVANGRLVGTTEPGAQERIKMLAGGEGPSTVNPELQMIVSEVKGEEGFMYFDLLGFVRPAINAAAAADPGAAQAKAMLSFLPGIDKLHTPLIYTYRGGTSLTTELRIPLRTFENLGKVLAPLKSMGMGGGMGGAASGSHGSVMKPVP